MTTTPSKFTNPSQKLFAGMMLYTSRKSHYAPHLGVEQHGNIFYRDSIVEYQDQSELGRLCTVEREIKSLIADALVKGREKQPGLSANPEDYYLANFSIGLEGMGHWETELEISGLSFTGKPVPESKQATSTAAPPPKQLTRIDVIPIDAMSR